MKFTTNSSDLQRVLTKVSGVIPGKSTMPILETMLFGLKGNTLSITGTDIDTTMSVSLGVQGSADGSVAIPSKRLVDTVRALPDSALSVAVDTTSNKVSLRTENGEFSLTAENAAEFPEIPEFKGMSETAFDASQLRRTIQQTVFAVSTDELRPAMMGVLMQVKGSDLRAVATDGHRLVKFSQKLDTPPGLRKDIIIPAKALLLVNKALEGNQVTMSVSDSHVRFSMDTVVVTSRLIDETYPNYESVIPTDNTKIMTINRDAMMQSLRRVALYASATTHQIRLAISGDALTISAQDMDYGGEAKETLPCEFTGDSVEIGFNATYMVDVLSHIDAEKAAFRFSSPTRAGIVTPSNGNAGDDVLMLVMPVRLNN